MFCGAVAILLGGSHVQQRSDFYDLLRCRRFTKCILNPSADFLHFVFGELYAILHTRTFLSFGNVLVVNLISRPILDEYW